MGPGLTLVWQAQVMRRDRTELALKLTAAHPPICKASSLVNPSTETGSQFTEDRSSSHKHITLLRHQPGLKEVHLPHSTAITHLINSNFVSFFKFMGTLRRIFPWARSMERAT